VNKCMDRKPAIRGSPESRRTRLEQIENAPRRFPHLTADEARQRERRALDGLESVLTATDTYSSLQDTPKELLAQFPRDTPQKGTDDEDMSKPVLFYGKPSQLDDVLTYVTIRNIVEANQTDQSQCGLLASLFRGQALHWLTAKLASTPKILDDYDEFTSALRTEFGLSDDARKGHAAQRLSTTYQKGPVQLYAIEMRNLFQTLSIDDDSARAYFIRGLKLHVREALVASGEYGTLDRLVDEAIRIDTGLYNARKPQRVRGMGGKTSSRGQLKCHNCGKFGHKASVCRSGKIKTEEY